MGRIKLGLQVVLLSISRPVLDSAMLTLISSLFSEVESLAATTMSYDDFDPGKYQILILDR